MENTFSEIKDQQKSQKNGVEGPTIKKMECILDVCAVSLV